MKKMLFLGSFAVLGLASCKKEYTCTCTGYIDGVAVPGSASSTTIKDTKSKATDACNTGDEADAGLGISVDCEIQ